MLTAPSSGKTSSLHKPHGLWGAFADGSAPSGKIAFLQERVTDAREPDDDLHHRRVLNTTLKTAFIINPRTITRALPPGTENI